MQFRFYIQKIFQYFDLENTGKITSRHLKKIAQEIGESLSDEELKEIMEEADSCRSAIRNLLERLCE